jgi:hypothetical protein
MLQPSGLGWPARSAGPLFRGAARSAVIAASCATVVIHGTKGRDHFLGLGARTGFACREGDGDLTLYGVTAR